MKVVRKDVIIVLLVIFAAVLLGISGCKKSGSEGSKAGQAFGASVDLCIKCGQIKGSELCCKPNQTICSGCSLVKGSPGCCKIPKDAQTVALCTKCGQIKGTELCCKLNQTTCSKCGLVKGSPGCCKISQK